MNKRLKIKIKNSKNRKISSTIWLNRNANDKYQIQAKELGYLSRAAFKLIEIDKKFKIITSGPVLDIGAAPGSWIQVLLKKGITEITAIDLQDLKIPFQKNILFLQGDFLQMKHNISKKFSLILSDMAPNSSGNQTIDHLRLINLLYAVLDFSINNLNYNGNLIVKVLQGAESQNLAMQFKRYFSKVVWFKPNASHSNSSEIYLLGLGFQIL
jgi:23S rRNA (uridine2552-2'-O)-methyltransferase